ncbi:MAG: hypothetical protein FWB76_06485, partial [Oscillospiraceae bacterium]|nr:hypothetical protein [Oscillospiraceae bacterium]
MLTLHITQGGSFELPLPLETLSAELKNLGVDKPLDRLTQHDFTLQAMNPLGAHFMKLLQPDDSLRRIAMFAREFDVLAGESRQNLADLVMADQFRDLSASVAKNIQRFPIGVKLKTFRNQCTKCINV